MDYAASVKHIERSLDQRRIQPAMQEMGSVLEQLLKELYRDYLPRLKPAERSAVSNKERETAEKIRARSGSADTFTLGQMVRFLQASGFFQKSVDARLAVGTLLNANLQPFVDARNEATHEARPPSENEARLYYHQLVQYLEDTGKLTTEHTRIGAEATLRPWTDVVVPHPDIREGRLEVSIYAANLWSVVFETDRCPEVYRTPNAFFSATYMTSNLAGLLRDVVQVLNGEAGDRVLQLRTAFGGGKTHSLIALYHLSTCAGALRQAALSDIGQRLSTTLTDPGPVGVCVLHGLRHDPQRPRTPEAGITLHTLWGELAYQLGGKLAYELVREEDERRVPPSQPLLKQIIGSDPALILLDEVLIYVEKANALTVGGSTYGRQVLIFLQTLTETIRGIDHAAMVYSLQASESEAFGAEGLLSELDHLVSRIDSKREPVNSDEILKVVQRRLFSELGPSQAREAVARAYAERYRSHVEADDPSGAAQEARRLEGRILDSYPLHPDLLDLMYHRWGSLPSYQRTRGALSFLATAISGIYNTPGMAQPLLSPGDILLDDDATRNALFTQVGEREHFNSVIAADITGGDRSADVDRRMGEASPILKRLRVGTRVATAAFLYSFGARQGEDRGVVRNDLIAACLSPELDRNIITTALHELQETLLYLHYVAGRYRFETKPNLNKLLADQARQYETAEITVEIRRKLDGIIGRVSGSDARPWPEDSAAVPDHQPSFQIAYLGPEWADLDKSELETRARQWIEMRGSSRRQYKNGLALAVPTSQRLEEARHTTRMLLAVDYLLGAQGRYNLSPDQVDDLKTRRQRLSGDLDNTLKRLYDLVGLPVEAQGSGDPLRIEWFDLRAQPLSSDRLQERIIEALRNWLFTSVTPGKLIGLSRLGADQTTQTLSCARLVEWCFSFLNFPKLLGTNPIQVAIAQGVSDGLIGYSAALQVDAAGQAFVANHRLVQIDSPVAAQEIDLSATSYLLAPELARQLAQPPAATALPTPVYPPTSEPGANGKEQQAPYQVGEAETPASEAPVSRTLTSGHRYRLQFTVNKQQLFRAFRPLQNLAEKAGRVEVTLDIVASSDIPLEASWLRNAVEEPLDEADVTFDCRLEE